MSFTRLAAFFLPISAVAVIASLVALVYPGPVLSIEFTGGTLIEVRLPDAATQEQLETSLQHVDVNGVSLAETTVTRTQAGTYFVRTATLDTDQHAALIAGLTKDLGKVQEL